MRDASLPFLALFSIPLLACGGTVVTPDPSGSGGASSSSSTTTTSTSSSSSSSSTSTGPDPIDAGMPAACGGKMGLACASTEYCQFDPTGSCGYADGLGLCQPRPDACPENCPGVCACDGQFYCNACIAASAGVDVSNDTGCMTKAPIYSAFNLLTHVPRFVVFKADWSRNVCVRLMVEGIGSGGIGIQSPAGWGVAMAEITNRASDCVLVNGYPAPPGDAAVTAASGSGTLTMKGTFPCEVSVHATLDFPAGSPAWVLPTEGFDVDALPVDGGCG